MHRYRIMNKASVKLPRKKGRLPVQGAAAIAQNSYLTGFVTGGIYQGAGKYVCLPGLNCYSCPGAIGSCPIGSLQNVLASYKNRISLYVTGLILMFGLALGRWICGWLCPFGLIQDLLHKIPSKKIRIKKLSWLKYLKYAVLGVLVILLPMLAVNAFGQGSPWFCKYVCPSGTVLAALPLAAANSGVSDNLGDLFILKASIAAAILILSVFIYRPFCRFLCPLGAIYGILNKVSLYRMRLSEDKCVKCGTCASVCRMEVDPVKSPNSAECIRCGDCAAACPKGALCLGFADKEKRAVKDA
jgi:ferredoxin-type protein NapH